jgi:hypothetical protein
VEWGLLLDSVGVNPISGQLLRIVESQEQVATLEIVDTLDEQALLEEMLEGSKAPVTGNYHYLLSTPFRYPPLPWGSRFGARFEPSIFYGSLDIEPLLSETAYYRFTYLSGMEAVPPKTITTQHTIFEVDYKANYGLQLQHHPFATHANILTDPVDYSATQQLGSEMRKRGVGAFEYTSARDPNHGINVGLFSPSALADSKPTSQTQWLCQLSESSVSFTQEYNPTVTSFYRTQFEIDGSIPAPA